MEDGFDLAHLPSWIYPPGNAGRLADRFLSLSFCRCRQAWISKGPYQWFLGTNRLPGLVPSIDKHWKNKKTYYMSYKMLLPLPLLLAFCLSLPAQAPPHPPHPTGAPGPPPPHPAHPKVKLPKVKLPKVKLPPHPKHPGGPPPPPPHR